MSKNTQLESAPLSAPALPIPVWEFVGLIAAMLALNALAIDSMLPALDNIADSYQLADRNDQQMSSLPMC